MAKLYNFNGIMPNSTHSKVLSYINENETVLEFGCASGYMSKVMHEELKCKVYGIDLCEEAINKARQFLEKGICADLEKLSWKDELEGVSFDTIMFADVLEHLRNPEEVLKTAVELLKPDGKVVVSIPHIGHGDIICKLLYNHFDYMTSGLLDDTHVHFWGSENIEPFCERCGLSLIELNGMAFPAQCTEQRLGFVPSKSILNVIAQNKYSSVYQFVFVAYKKEYAAKNGLCLTKPIDALCDNIRYFNDAPKNNIKDIAAEVLECVEKYPNDEKIKSLNTRFFAECAPAVYPESAKLFAEDGVLLDYLTNGYRKPMVKYIVSLIANHKYTKQYDLAGILCNLSRDKPIANEIPDEKFIGKYGEIYLLIWNEKYAEALEQMTDILLKSLVPNDTFYEVYLTLAASLECADEFVFGKIRQAHYLCDNGDKQKAAALLEEVADMGVEDNEEMAEIRAKI